MAQTGVFREKIREINKSAIELKEEGHTIFL